MTLVSVVYDNFNDNSIDSTMWSPVGSSTLQTETGGKLNTPCAASSAPTVMRSSRNFYDLRKGRLAIRYSRAGTTDPNVYTYWGLRDYLGWQVTLFARSNDYTFQMATNDAGAGTLTQTETTIGMGPSWTANTYLGWTFTEATKTYSLGKSTDGVTWTEIAKYVVSGTLGNFNYRRAGLSLGCTSYGTVTNFTPSWDDMTYFIDHTNLRIKTKSGGTGANTAASTKVRVGGVWKRAIPRVRVGGNWSQSQ